MAKRLSVNRTIEVIMLQNDKHLGEKYEIVRVKPIFARNVLFPNNIAILADKEAKNNYAQKMEAAKASREKKAASLEDLFSKISADEWIEIIRKANKDNTLYAKVDENDIAAKINEVYGIEVEPHLFKLKKKLSEVGTYNVTFAYNNLKRDITVKVTAEIDEKAQKEEKKEEVKEVVKTKEEIRAEREAAKAKEKAEKIAKLKEKYK